VSFFEEEDVTIPRLARSLTMPVLCLASLSRSLVGVAGGASKVIIIILFICPQPLFYKTQI
jgi:hypothetical protein